jgi:hypothetical protein
MHRDHNDASSNGTLGERCEVIMIAVIGNVRMGLKAVYLWTTCSK